MNIYIFETHILWQIYILYNYTFHIKPKLYLNTEFWSRVQKKKHLLPRDLFIISGYFLFFSFCFFFCYFKLKKILSFLCVRWPQQYRSTPSFSHLLYVFLSFFLSHLANVASRIFENNPFPSSSVQRASRIRPASHFCASLLYIILYS